MHPQQAPRDRFSITRGRPREVELARLLHESLRISLNAGEALNRFLQEAAVLQLSVPLDDRGQSFGYRSRKAFANWSVRGFRR